MHHPALPEMDASRADSLISAYKERIKHGIDPNEKTKTDATVNPITSNVYLCATPEEAHAVSAVKISRIEGVTNRQALTSAYLEADVIGNNKLAHPNIVRGFGALFGTSEVLLCMEYLEGGDLLTHICSSVRGMHNTKVRWLAHQLCSAVAFIHSSGYVHSDIKTENVLIEDAVRMNIKLADFGYVRRVDAPLKEGEFRTSRGSIHYASPELLAPGGFNTYESDSWAVGVVIYVAATSMMPFDGKDIGVVVKRIKTEEPKYVYIHGQHWDKGSPPIECQTVLRAFLLKDAGLRMKVTKAEQDPWIRDAKPLQTPMSLPSGE